MGMRGGEREQGRKGEGENQGYLVPFSLPFLFFPRRGDHFPTGAEYTVGVTSLAAAAAADLLGEWLLLVT